MLAIELDGYSHKLEEVVVKDKRKEAELKLLGVTVLWFVDSEVFYDINNVLRIIELYIENF